MASLNKVMLIGNVTRDPEVKFTPKGSAVADLGLAVNRTYTNQAGEKTEEVTYIDVELWGRLAEIAGEYAKKGRSIFIEGRLRLDSWEDKQSGRSATVSRWSARSSSFSVRVPEAALPVQTTRGKLPAQSQLALGRPALQSANLLTTIFRFDRISTVASSRLDQ